MAWRIKFDGHVLRESEMTIDQAEQIEYLAGTTWRFINPLYSAKHGKAVLAVMYAARTGATYDDVVDKVGAITCDAYADMVEEDTDDTPATFEDGFPQSVEGPSTAT